MTELVISFVKEFVISFITALIKKIPFSLISFIIIVSLIHIAISASGLKLTLLLISILLYFGYLNHRCNKLKEKVKEIDSQKYISKTEFIAKETNIIIGKHNTVYNSPPPVSYTKSTKEDLIVEHILSEIKKLFGNQINIDLYELQTYLLNKNPITKLNGYIMLLDIFLTDEINLDKETTQKLIMYKQRLNAFNLGEETENKIIRELFKQIKKELIELLQKKSFSKIKIEV